MQTNTAHSSDYGSSGPIRPEQVGARAGDVKKRPIAQLGLAPGLHEKCRIFVYAENLASNTESQLSVRGFTAKDLAKIRAAFSVSGLSFAMPQEHRPHDSPTALKPVTHARQEVLVDLNPDDHDVVASASEGALVHHDERDGATFLIPNLFAEALREDLAKRASARGRKPKVTDDERAREGAHRQSTRATNEATCDNPRVEELRKTTAMDVGDAAFLYGVSKDAIYAACRRDEIPHRRFGSRIRVLTRPVFAELGLD